eukprot:scaffold325627_cov72-Tisochrysis_lutea.AAC.1
MAKRVASLRTSFARAVAAVTRPSSARPTSGAYGGVRPSSARAMLASAVSSARGFLASRGGSARGTSNTSHSTCRVVPSAQGGDGGALCTLLLYVNPLGTMPEALLCWWCTSVARNLRRGRTCGHAAPFYVSQLECGSPGGPSRANVNFWGDGYSISGWWKIWRARRPTIVARMRQSSPEQEPSAWPWPRSRTWQ